MTPVLFRCDYNGEHVTACFPTLPGSPGCATCYEHVGQHGSYRLSWYFTTRKARPDEYADLLAELVSIGYDDLKVYQRETRWMRDEMRKAERAYEQAAERQSQETV